MRVLFLSFIILIIAASLFFLANSKSSSQNVLQALLPTIVPSTLTEKQKLAQIYSIEAMRNRVYSRGVFSERKFVYATSRATVYRVSYQSDGLTVYALLSIPKSNDKTEKFPVLIFNHGYIDPKVYSTINSYKNTFDYFANQPYVVIKPDYRGNGQSEGDKNNPLNRLMYAVDVVNLIYAIPSITEADTTRIAAWGHSMGGDVTVRAMEITDKIKGASLWAPVSADYPESSLYFLRKHNEAEVEQIEKLIYDTFSQTELSEYSPSQQLDFFKGQLLIQHGTSDESVPFEWSVTFDNKLTKNNIPHLFYEYRGEDHNFTHGSRNLVLERDIEFFSSLFK